MKNAVSFSDFAKLDLRVGTIVSAENFPEANTPAYQLIIDFGNLGVKKTSAQITTIYTKTSLINRQVVALINIPKKQIANMQSECLVLGVVKAKDVFLLQPETQVANGSIIS